MDFSYITFPFETLLAVLLVSSHQKLKYGWPPRIKAGITFGLVTLLYFVLGLSANQSGYTIDTVEMLYLPFICILYLGFAAALAVIVQQLYDVTPVEALVTMVMGYGLQHLSVGIVNTFLRAVPLQTLGSGLGSGLGGAGSMAAVGELAADTARILIMAVCYAIAYHWLTPRFHIHVEAVQQSMRWVWLSVFILSSAIVFNMVLTIEVTSHAGGAAASSLGAMGTGGLAALGMTGPVVPLAVEYSFRIMDFLCTLLGMSVLLLVSTRDQLMSDLDMLTHLNEAKVQHYDMSRENMELVNAKFHDVRKSLASVRATIQNLDGLSGVDSDALNVPAESLKSMQELENAIRIYDSIFQTGDDFIDSVLTEKSLYCSAHSIRFNAMVDGRAFSFLEPADVAALFGNIIDNAIEAVESSSLPDEQRVIELSAHVSGGYAVLSSSNFYTGSVTISSETGLPVSAKTDSRFHGYGMKSIAAVVQERGGQVNVQADNDAHIFEIRVVLPVE
ncbi:ATP-binding protein [Alloscardovia macacae]|uniref:GHKL domain-containing protein n=1 Tax=Alloscardovia macacae TaxID=1160091 RepID=A0A261F7E8_9BIFI|nr:ATP-binding protein [Alloscardovia macacae]OZG55070.1 GHKL domain-containing protein [Alloscardovia macacae]